MTWSRDSSVHNFMIYIWIARFAKNIPTPGVEPGPSGWKPDILAVRPRGNNMFSPGIEPGTFCVLDRCDNRYTMKTCPSSNWNHTRWPSLERRFATTWRRSHLSTKSLVSRDRLVVRTLRCGRSNPGSNPGHGMQKHIFLWKKFLGSTGIWTRDLSHPKRESYP